MIQTTLGCPYTRKEILDNFFDEILRIGFDWKMLGNLMCAVSEVEQSRGTFYLYEHCTWLHKWQYCMPHICLVGLKTPARKLVDRTTKKPHLMNQEFMQHQMLYHHSKVVDGAVISFYPIDKPYILFLMLDSQKQLEEFKSAMNKQWKKHGVDGATLCGEELRRITRC